MYKVNIYIEADKKAPQRLERRYCFLLEYIRKNGRAETRFASKEARTTYNTAVMESIAEALGRLEQNCEVLIYTDNRYAKGMFETQLDTWEKKDFKASTGRDVAHRKEWEKISAYRRQHIIKFVGNDREHTNQLQEEMKACKVN